MTRVITAITVIAKQAIPRRIAMRKLILMVLLLTTGAWAQNLESLLIGPGDLLHVQVFDTPELEQHARVTDAGELPLLMGGNVKVAHLTPAEAARSIEKVLLDGQFLLRPRVAVTVEEYATQKVSVLGEVKTPGAYAITTPRSVLDVLSLAGGLTDLADRRILIERKGTNEKTPYFVSNKADVAVNTAVRISPGDTLVVPKAGIVYVLGDVRQPGGYTMTNNEAQLSVLQLVARAGGTNNSAVPAHTRLMRKTGESGYSETQLQLSAMQKGKQPDQFLQAGDILYIPFSYMKNFALQGSGLAASAASAAIYRF
jgi:polysaccharide export outer membrane protein